MFLNQLIEQAGLAHIGPTNHRNGKPVTKNMSVYIISDQSL